MSIQVGSHSERVFAVTDDVISAFAAASGDHNPVHLDQAYAASTRFGGRIAHGMLTAGFISAVIGNDLPGHGSIYVGQTLAFRAPVRPGDDVRVRVEVLTIDASRRRATLLTEAFVGDTLVVTGEARVVTPD